MTKFAFALFASLAAVPALAIQPQEIRISADPDVIGKVGEMTPFMGGHVTANNCNLTRINGSVRQEHLVNPVLTGTINQDASGCFPNEIVGVRK